MFGGLLYIMQEIKVNNIIIGKQYKSSENYEEFIKIVKEKKINVKIVEGGEKVSIEDNLYFDIIWPFSDNMISDNSINSKKMFKNTFMLYIRQIVILVINLVSVRILLHSFGEDDYGLYKA